MMEKVAIVILNWNGAAMLERFLPNVLRHSQDEAVVYVADNASTDNSLLLLEERFPEVRVLRLDRNWGFAGGYNRALAQIEAEYYVLLNSDVEVTAHWLQPLVQFMDSHPDVAACQPKLLSERNHAAFEYAGACGGYLDRYGYPFCRGRIFSDVENDEGQYDTVAQVMWATGACMLVRAADYRVVGGLDERFFAHCEEIDLCWRMALQGRTIYCVPQSAVYHVGGGTLPKENPMKTYLNFRNNLTMLYKNLPSSSLRRVMLVRCLLDYVAALQFWLSGHRADSKAVVKARRDFRQWRSSYREERERLQRGRVVEHVEGIYGFSLLWRYHALRRRVFSRLVE